MVVEWGSVALTETWVMFRDEKRDYRASRPVARAGVTAVRTAALRPSTTVAMTAAAKTQVDGATDSPKNSAANAIVSGAPLFRWAPVGGASYFNLQLFRGRTKVLSAWPRLARLNLPGRWRYDDRDQRLEPGVYTWYVWPGYGDRADARYGQLLGKSRFRVVPATG